MARKNPKIKAPITLSTPGYITPSLGTIGAPVGIGSNARALAKALSGFSTKLGALGREQVSKQEIEEKLKAEEEFLTAKRAGTLDQFRKATMEGLIPEGASPAYNDFRKVLSAKDAIQNIYATEIELNMDALVDPDAPQASKTQIMEDAFAKTGIEQLGLDPVGRGIVNATMLKMQSRLDGKANARSIELNKIKMNEAIGTDAINALGAYGGDRAELVDSFTNSIKIARAGSVMDPVKRVTNAYFKQITNIASDDPDKAQDLLNTIVESKYEDGTKVIGNLELITAATKMEDQIERAIINEDRMADNLLKVQLNKVSTSLEEQIPMDEANNPDSIKAVYDSFLQEQAQLPADKRLPRRVLDGLQGERDTRLKKATQKANAEDSLAAQEARYSKQRNGLVANRANDITSEEDFNLIMKDIDARDDITTREKMELKRTANIAKSAQQLSTKAFKDNVTPEVLQQSGLSKEIAATISGSLGIDLSEVGGAQADIEEGMQRMYSSEFSKELSRLASERDMTYEQALLMNKSRLGKSEQGMDPEFQHGDNLVMQASAKALEVSSKYAKDQMVMLTDSYKYRDQSRLVRGNALVKAITTERVAGLRAVANSEDASPQEKVGAREILVNTRSHLMQLSKEIDMFSNVEPMEFAVGKNVYDLNDPSVAKHLSNKLDKYYALQNSLGYSLKEILARKSIAGVPLDATRIDVRRTKIVWNRKELEVMKRIDIGDLNELAGAFGLTAEELIIAQENLLK